MTPNLRNLLLPALVLGITASAMAQTADNPPAYSFRRANTPDLLESYETTLFSSDAEAIRTMRGDALHNLKKHHKTTAFKISPAGNLFAIVETDKKGNNTFEIRGLQSSEDKRFSFDAKHLGTPRVALFTPDARNVVVVTDNYIYTLEGRKYKPVGRMDRVPLQATDAVFSPNGYFLVLTEGSKAAIYNFEAKSMRKLIDAEVDISDVVFSPGSDLMAILTNDGLLSIYDTRTFEVRSIIDDLGNGLAASFNSDGKYIAVATDPASFEVVNTVRPTDRREFSVPDGGMTDLVFIKDAHQSPILAHSGEKALYARRILDLEPAYSRLVSETVDGKMAEWLKMQPGETAEEYAARVTDESRRKQQRLFEDEISTSLAGDLLSMSEMSLGSYDRNNSMLNVEFSNLPPIWLPVPETDLTSINSAADLSVSDAQYGLLPDDSFELIYAKFHNDKAGKTYIYDNVDRVPMTMLDTDHDFVSLDIIRQQQMEEIRLQEVKEKVMAEAKKNNIISDHTNITVDSRIEPAYDADGNKILNYIVKFSYQVEPEFSAVEDFPPGKYVPAESGASSSMLDIVKKSFEGDLAQYAEKGKRLNVNISGTADATPIVRTIAYDGVFGDFEEEPVTVNGQLTTITVTSKDGISTNEQLAFLRAAGVADSLRGIPAVAGMDTRYNYNVGVSQDKGSEHRRITAEFIFVDAFN